VTVTCAALEPVMTVAVTTPSFVTDATEGFDDVHVTARPISGSALFPTTMAVSAVSAPLGNRIVDGEMFTAITGRRPVDAGSAQDSAPRAEATTARRRAWDGLIIEKPRFRRHSPTLAN
jgi:hypothetical protein